MRGAETIVERSLRDTKGFNQLIVAEDKESTSMRMECVLQDWNASTQFQKAVKLGEAHTAELVPIRALCGFISRERKSKL